MRLSRSFDVADGDVSAGLAGQELLEGVVGLLAEFACGRTGTGCAWPTSARSSSVAERDGHTGLAGAGRLDDQRLAVLGGEPLDDPLDRLDLVHAAGDAAGRAAVLVSDSRLARWKMQVFEAVLGVEAVELAGRLALARRSRSRCRSRWCRR